MISRVAIKNFKSIGDPGVDLELKPLTLLVGPNGGGKSSILEAIAVASQRNIQGRSTDYPSPRNVMHKAVDSRVVIEVEFAPISNETMGGYRFSGGAGRAFDIEHLSANGAVQSNTNRLSSELRANGSLISSVRGDVSYSAEASGTPEWVGVHSENLLLLLAIIFGHLQHRPVARKIANWDNASALMS